MTKRNNKTRQCAAATKSGKQCNRKATHGRYCAQHAKAKGTKSVTQSAAGTTGISNAEFAEKRLAAARDTAEGDVSRMDYAIALNAKFANHAKPFKVPHWSQIRKSDTNDNNRSYYDDKTKEAKAFKEAYKVAYTANHNGKAPSEQVVNSAWGKVTTDARKLAGIKPKAKVSTMQTVRIRMGSVYKFLNSDKVGALKGNQKREVEAATALFEQALEKIGVNAAGLLSE